MNDCSGHRLLARYLSPAQSCAQCPPENNMAKGIEKSKKNNKDKVSTQDKQKKKKEKQASKGK